MSTYNKFLKNSDFGDIFQNDFYYRYKDITSNNKHCIKNHSLLNSLKS